MALPSMKNGRSFEGNDVRLVLMVTNDCCLKCEYCMVPKSTEYMSWETLKRSADLLLSSKKKNLQIQFFGGEPLMMPFGLMKKIILYSRLKAGRLGKKIDFMITTNGVPLTDEKIRFFKKFDVRLEFSIDGGPETQNSNRPQKRGGRSSYELATEHIPKVIMAGVPFHDSAVVFPARAHALVDDFIHLAKHIGFKEISMMIACGIVWSDAQIKTLRKKLKELESVYCDLLRKEGTILFNVYEWMDPFRVNNEITVDVDGMVYPGGCVFFGSEKIKKTLTLGHVKDVGRKGMDVVYEGRWKNKEALNIFETFVGSKALQANIKAGREVARFVARLNKKLKSNKELYAIYFRGYQKFK